MVKYIMDKDLFAGLVEYLSGQIDFSGLGPTTCDGTFALTEAFLQDNGYAGDGLAEKIEWSRKHGAFCDCGILLNIESWFNQGDQN